MAGTLFGLAKSTVFDTNGDLARGALLYVYAENSSTPSTTYSDFALTTSQVWPLEADSAGRIPTFWVADGNYRARLTTSTGVDIFDDQSITALGASTGGASGGSTSQDTTTIFQTGDVIWTAGPTSRSGWVRVNGKTIGNGSSGATERANADTQDLFEFLWNNLGNSICAVSSGRGGTATADFNAAKTITLLDLRGRALFGADDLGNSAASRLTAGTPTSQGTSGGAEKQTIALTNLPSTTLTSNDVSGLLTLKYTKLTNIAATGATSVTRDLTSGGTTSVTDALSGTVTTPLGGSGTALATTPPYLIGFYWMKL